MALQQDGALIERFRLRDREELHALDAGLIEKMLMVMEAESKVQNKK